MFVTFKVDKLGFCSSQGVLSFALLIFKERREEVESLCTSEPAAEFVTEPDKCWCQLALWKRCSQQTRPRAKQRRCLLILYPFGWCSHWLYENVHTGTILLSCPHQGNNRVTVYPLYGLCVWFGFKYKEDNRHLLLMQLKVVVRHKPRSKGDADWTFKARSSFWCTLLLTSVCSLTSSIITNCCRIKASLNYSFLQT